MPTSKLSVYIAGPLFTDRQRKYNEQVAKEFIRAGFDVYLPQVDTGAAQYDEQGRCINSVKSLDLQGLEDCTFIAASFWDGFIDEGTCYEVGYAEAKNIPVYIISDDHRPMRNEMFSGIMKFPTPEALVQYLVGYYGMEGALDE